MYKIENKPYGYKLTFSGIINRNELSQWQSEFKKSIDKGPGAFYVFVDMREMELLPVDSQETMHQGQMYAKEKGMQRSVVIFSSDITSMQFKLIAKKTGIYSEERYIDAMTDPDWEKNGLDWILSGIEPANTMEIETVSLNVT